MSKYNRRKFLKQSTLTAASAATGATVINSSCKTADIPAAQGTYMGDYAAPAIAKIKVAIIGVGARGKGHIKFFGSLPNVEVVAISDLYEDNIDKSISMLKEASGEGRHNNISRYFGAEDNWKKMLAAVKPDVCFIATNWKNHAPMAIEAMNQGAHAFVEVPIALTIEEMWGIVDTSERTKKHCMMLENVNYFRAEMMFLNMVRQNLIGEILHGEAAYIHDLRGQMNEVERGTGSWRTLHYANGSGNLYPTHGLGPVAQYMNLARSEDNFKSIVAYGSPARGRKLYAEKNYPADHKWNQLDYKNGDMQTSIIKTTLGRTIMVQWDETSPRPYSRHNLVQGTRGILSGHDHSGNGVPIKIALDGGVAGATKSSHSWAMGDDLNGLIEKYEHPFYTRTNETAKASGHGGGDGIMLYRIWECLSKGQPLDQNVYEGCFWSAVTPLSAKSIAEDGMPQAFPDFTRGNWKTTLPLGIVT